MEESQPVTIGQLVGSTVCSKTYWIATSDSARDEPVRQRALRQAGGDAWAALEVLAAGESV